ncbi:MAG: prephenate dehydrogenase [Lachnospiraceae bacterium]|nr:prephenate dehydrogenase [Lachnospiraceae bacterium]
MTTAGVIGWGLIGGSMAKAIKKAGHTVYGYNRTTSVIGRALSEGVADAYLTKENAADCDFLIVALMPDVTVSLIRQFAPYLKKGCIVVDCTGIKSAINIALSGELARQGLFFVGGHPMAGKEVAGYENSEAELFANASMILCRDGFTDEEAYGKAEAFFRGIGFPRIKETTPEEHDRVIAYTSQMAHVVSNAYIKNSVLPERYGFSAGSFKDLTRVAKLDENMWTDLFFANREALLSRIEEFMGHMEEYRKALSERDEDRMRELLREGRILKENDEENEKAAFEKMSGS